MKRSTQALLLVLAGVALLHACLMTDLSLRYVKDGMRPFLIGSGVLLMLLGTLGAMLDGFPLVTPSGSSRAPDTGTGEDMHGHDHSSGPRIAWLLFLPVLALLLYAPPALGSYTAARESGEVAKPADQHPRMSPLPKKNPAPLSLTEFALRAREDSGESLERRTVLMTGFATPGKHGEWFLTRMIVNCCAADSTTVKIRMHGETAPRPDTWVTVTGRMRPHATEPALDVASTKRIPRPAAPYSDSTPQDAS